LQTTPKKSTNQLDAMTHCINNVFGDNAQHKPLVVQALGARPPSTTTAMLKVNGHGRPHQIWRPNDRRCHRFIVPAFFHMTTAHLLNKDHCAV
jgi:hypothetical protein